jgi:DNA-binding XRE family transcriptional regulator
MTRPAPAYIPDLRVRRQRAGLTQQRLAAVADVSIATVGFIERGGTCSPAMAEKLLAAIDAQGSR